MPGMETATTTDVETLAPDVENNRWAELNATFWKSPFAISAATTIVAEFMLLMSDNFGGSTISPDLYTAMTFLAASMFAAGTMPAWNRLRCDEEGLDQHAGLTHFHVDWSQVKSVTPVSDGVRISYVDTRKEKPVVRREFLQNRYDLDGDAFRRLIEQRWLENAVLPS